MMKKKAIDFKNQTPSGINYNQLFVVKKTEKDFFLILKNQTPSGEGVNWSYETQFKVMKKLFLSDKVTKTSKKTS